MLFELGAINALRFRLVFKLIHTVIILSSFRIYNTWLPNVPFTRRI